MARSVQVCPLIKARHRMSCRPRRPVCCASMKAGHSNGGARKMRPGNSRLATCLPPCPGDPAKRTLLCTGRPFKQWFPVVGGRTGNTPRYQSWPYTSPTPSPIPPGGLLSPVVAESWDIGTSHGHAVTASRPPIARDKGASRARLWILRIALWIADGLRPGRTLRRTGYPLFHSNLRPQLWRG